MESRFGHLLQRDCSVSMLKLKMSRRRSQIQKENRERVYNLHRHLDELPEQDFSRGNSVLENSAIPAQGQAPQGQPVKTASEERMKMLARYKETKVQQKEKAKREREKKGVFKCGLYKPTPLAYLPQNTPAPSSAKTTEPSTRVTRSMKQQPQVQKAAPRSQAAPKKAEPTACAPTTRAANKNQVPFPTAPKTRSTNKQLTAPPAGREKNTKGNTETKLQTTEHKSAVQGRSAGCPEPAEEKMAEDPPAGDYLPALPSFAPQGFVFEAPVGLTAFQPTPLSPRSADAFLSPSLEPRMEPSVPSPPVPTSAPPADSSPPPISPPLSSAPPLVSPAPVVPSSPSVPQEPPHDVPYFRAVMASETERLRGLSELWLTRFEDASIPEEMLERMRTAVGQARLLMKERFGQFSGLVDDCDLGRGEKVTTCTDLQGFWEMVYFQVEDVNRKFAALKEAELSGWQEEKRPPPRQKKVVKPPSAAAPPKAGRGASTAAKSRLASIKATMKAKQQQAAAEKASLETGPTASPAAPANTLAVQTMVFQGGFFQVESPVKQAESVRSSRLSVNPSPCLLSRFSTPVRLRRSTAVSRPSPLPRMTLTPAHHPEASPTSTTRRSPQPCAPAASRNSPRIALHFSPECASRTDRCTPSQSELDSCPAGAPLDQPGLIPVPAASPMDQPGDQNGKAEDVAQSPPTIKPQNLHDQDPGQTATEVPTCSSAQSEREARPEAECNPEAVSASPSQREALSPPAVQALSPAPHHNASVAGNDGSSAGADVEMSGTPDTSYTEGLPDLDFDRYLQTTVRLSLSPGETSVTTEMFPPMATNVEMESPVLQPPEEQSQEVLLTPTGLPRLAPLFTPRDDELTESDLLLFTPEQRDRVRQSVCERDFMIFTPPTNK